MSSITYHKFDGFPPSVSPSSHATEYNNIISLTGQFGRNLERPDDPLPAGIVLQTEQTLKNLQKTLSELNLDLSHVLSVRVFLTHFSRDYEAMNEVYARYFTAPHQPTRTCVGVTELVRDALIELDCIAIRPALVG